MNFYIQEWENGQATLMSEDGMSIFTFPDVVTAERTCREWYQYNLANSEIHYDTGQDVSCSTCMI